MQQHYGLTDVEYKKLLDNGITIADLYNNVKVFDKLSTGEPIGKINLYYYIDDKGDFNAPPVKLKHKQIARALFESLDISASEKMQILQYIEDAKDNFEDGESE